MVLIFIPVQIRSRGERSDGFVISHGCVCALGGTGAPWVYKVNGKNLESDLENG